MSKFKNASVLIRSGATASTSIYSTFFLSLKDALTDTSGYMTVTLEDLLKDAASEVAEALGMTDEDEAEDFAEQYADEAVVISVSDGWLPPCIARMAENGDGEGAVRALREYIDLVHEVARKRNDAEEAAEITGAYMIGGSYTGLYFPDADEIAESYEGCFVTDAEAASHLAAMWLESDGEDIYGKAPWLAGNIDWDGVWSSYFRHDYWRDDATGHTFRNI